MVTITSFIDVQSKEELATNTYKQEELDLIFKVERVEIEGKEYRLKKKVYSLQPDRKLKIYVTSRSATEVLM